MRRTVLTAVAGLLLSTAAVVTPQASAQAAPLTNVLVFSKTAGFRHDAIPAGIAAIRQLGTQNGFSVTATEDAAQFTTANLAQYQAVVFLSTTGDVLNAAQQTAFEQYIASGKGYVGVHAAADTEYDWAWYGGLVGAYFLSHPAIQQANVRVEEPTNPSTAHLPQTWTRTDEWYNYRTNPRSRVRVLANLDEASYSGGSMGDHPITWCQNYGGGRAWYTGLGHTQESYSDANFTRMLLGGLQIAAGSVTANCTPVTQPVPTGAAVRARVNNRYVAAENSGTAALIANRAAVGLWEQFDVVDLGGGNVALNARVNGQYVSANNNATLIANRTTVGPWETFARVTNSDGSVSLRVQANGMYVCAENAGANPLVANRGAIGAWEKFDLVGI
jgi:type 1 glutamine amidotransferase